MKRVLMVKPDAFHLGWMGSTQRIFHFSAAFRQIGYDVALLAGKRRSRDEKIIERKFPGLIIRTNYTGAYPHFLDLFPLSRKAQRIFWKIRGLDYYLTKLSLGWSDATKINDLILRLKYHEFIPDLIWAVSGGWLDGGKVSSLISERIGVPWIFELQDPPYGCVPNTKRSTLYTEFNQLLKNSILQIVTTESYRQGLIKEFDLDPQRIYVIYGCYEGEPIMSLEYNRSQQWRLLYSGNLDGGRSLSSLLYGFYRAVEEEPKIRDDAIIDFVGKGTGFNEVKKLVYDLNLEDIINIYGYKPKEVVEKIMHRSNVFIVVQTEETSKLQIPGKIFQYLKFCKPILAIMPIKSEAAELLTQSGLGIIHPQEDIDGIKESIVRLWHDWKAGYRNSINYDFIKSFSVTVLPNKLLQILRNVP